jgi:hypothetical protein
MVMVSSLIGVLIFAFGVVLYQKQRKITGSILVVGGVCLVVLGLIALLNFHL